jgi:hypothetical protein
LNSVVLPAPFGPMIPSISPLSPVPIAILARIVRLAKILVSRLPCGHVSCP